MHDPGHGRHNAEVAEGFLPPFQKFIPFAVAMEFHFSISCERVCGREKINLDRMVNDQVHRHQRIDLPWVTTKARNCCTHCGQVHYCGYSGKILHDDTRRKKRNPRANPVRSPGGDVLHIALLDLQIVTLTERCFEHDSDRKRKSLEIRETRFFQCIQTIDNVILIPHFYNIPCFEEIVHFVAIGMCFTHYLLFKLVRVWSHHKITKNTKERLCYPWLPCGVIYFFKS